MEDLCPPRPTERGHPSGPDSRHDRMSGTMRFGAPSARSRSSILVSTLLLISVALAACGPAQHSFLGTQYNPREPVPEVELTDSNGRPFRLSNHFGQPILMFFGYTHCPDVCPATVYNVSWVFDRLESVEDLDALFIMITVDPERDSPQVLGQFLGGFDSSFVGLTGAPETLAQIYDGFGITVQRDEDGQAAEGLDLEHPDEAGYSITHTSRVFAIDKRGNLAVSYSFGTDPEVILTDVLYLIHEQ